MTQRHPAGRPGLLLGAGQRRQPERRGARAGHHDAGGQQAPGADGVAPRACSLVNRTTRRMSLTPEGELYLRARAPHPRRDRRHGASCSASSKATPQGPAARQRHAGLRAQPRGAADLALRAQAPAGRGAAAAVGQPAAADRRRLRRLHPLRRAAGRARDRPAHRAEPPAAVRRAGLPGQARHAQGAERPDPAQLHRHPPGRGGLRRVAPGQRTRPQRDAPRRSRCAAT